METLRFLMATTFYPPYHLGGDAVHVRYLAEALAKQGHEVHVEFSPAAYRLKRREPPSEAAPADGVQLHPIPSPMGRAQPVAAYAFGGSPGVTRHHERLCAQVRPDVVHLHNISLLGLGVLRRHRVERVLYTAHDYWVRCPRSDLRKYGKRFCERPACVSCCLATRRPPQLWRRGHGWRGLPGVDCAIAPSRFMAHAIAPHVACPIVHLPNFAPDPNPRGTLTPPQDYFLFVGALEPHKGVLELAAAASRPGSAWIKVVGRGSLSRRLEGWCRDHCVRLDLEGWVSEERMGKLTREARALVIPSTWPENAPLVAVEALAWGTPLLASRRGGLGELLYDGAAGRSFEPTTDELSISMAAFEAEGLPRRLRASARAAYTEHHRPEAYLARYLNLVREPSRQVAEVRALASAREPSLGSVSTVPGGGLP